MSQYYNKYQNYTVGDPRMQHVPQPNIQMPFNGFGYNPENLYETNSIDNMYYPEENQENIRYTDNSKCPQPVRMPVLYLETK